MTMTDIIKRYEVRAEATNMRPTVFDDTDGTEKEYSVILLLVSAKDMNGKRKSHIFPLVNSSGKKCRSSSGVSDILLSIVVRGKFAQSGFFSDWQNTSATKHEKHCPARLRFYLDSNCHDGLRELFDEQTLRDLYGIFDLPEAKEEKPQQIMTDDEYAEARNTVDGPICPICRATSITVTIPLRWDGYDETTGLATERFCCDSCKRRWTEILRPIAYEYVGG